MRTVICRDCGEPFATGERGRMPLRCDGCFAEYTRAKGRERHAKKYGIDPAYTEQRRAAARRAKENYADEKWIEQKIRRAASREARERGVPTEQILREWRVPGAGTTSEQPPERVHR